MRKAHGYKQKDYILHWSLHLEIHVEENSSLLIAFILFALRVFKVPKK